MKLILSVVIAASLAMNSFLAYKLWSIPASGHATEAASELVVMRTPGGLLEVSTITAEERFDSTTRHTVLGVPLGKTVAQIRVPAVYRYHIPLAKEWTFRSGGIGDTLIVVAPPVQPTLPVAIDTGKLESFSGGIWSPLTGEEALASLQKTITATLGEKAATAQLIQLQRESARMTVTEFVRKWVIEQTRWRGTKVPPVVLVFFADEPLGIKAFPLLSAK